MEKIWKKNNKIYNWIIISKDFFLEVGDKMLLNTSKAEKLFELGNQTLDGTLKSTNKNTLQIDNLAFLPLDNICVKRWIKKWYFLCPWIDWQGVYWFRSVHFFLSVHLSPRSVSVTFLSVHGTVFRYSCSLGQAPSDDLDIDHLHPLTQTDPTPTPEGIPFHKRLLIHLCLLPVWRQEFDTRYFVRVLIFLNFNFQSVQTVKCGRTKKIKCFCMVKLFAFCWIWIQAKFNASKIIKKKKKKRMWFFRTKACVRCTCTGMLYINRIENVCKAVIECLRRLNEIVFFHV